MIQRRYVLKSGLDADELVSMVADDPDLPAARDSLLLVFAAQWDHDALAASLSRLDALLPGVHVVAATTLGSDNPDIALPDRTHATLLLTQDATFDVRAYDCPGSSEAAGEEHAAAIASLAHPKAMLLLSADIVLYPADFIDPVHQQFPNLTIFGEEAGKSRIDASDDSAVWANGRLVTRGVVAVTMCGESLLVRADYNLGWRSIGRDLYATRTEGIGNVREVGGRPALDLYRRYLDVYPDAAFYDNVCSFPLLEEVEGRLVARVPFGYSEDGALLFSMRVNENVPLRLSYARPEYLLGEALLHANGMAAFRPQALLGFVCMNRRIFLGNGDADRELGYYRHALPTFTWTYGSGEILVDAHGGSVLNSSLVSVGLREGDVRDEGSDAPGLVSDPGLVPNTAYMPLSERLVTFLEATTAELRDTIGTLEVLAERDELTGVYNRRRTEAALSSAFEARADASPLSMVMYDIDHFKNVNDTHGHDVGDTVLRELTQVVLGELRPTDEVGRWGGEEFVVVCPRTSEQEAAELAERARAAVEAHAFDGVGQVTISFGVAQALEDDAQESLFSRADKALYDAKRAGRNRVRVR